MLETGTRAPDFTLLDQNGHSQTLSQYQGKWRVVYFYPKDNTPGCTIEACSIRDNWDYFKENDIEVFGVSGDSVESHRAFHKNHNLPFYVLSDQEKKVIMQYGAWGEKLLFGKRFQGIKRMTFIINPQGIVEKVFKRVTPIQHGKEVMKSIEEIKGRSHKL